VALLLVLSTASATAQAPGRDETMREPLPLDVAVSLRGHNGRSPVNFSPDGEWIAHTIETDETVPRGSSSRYADTGFPFSEGNARMEATLSSTYDDREIRLGSADAASWAAVWSPAGDRVAFYSDEGGEAGLWIWDRTTKTSRRIGDFIVRPAFGFEMPRWSSDGTNLLVKLLPEGVSLAQANAYSPAPRSEPAVPPVHPDEPSVTVRRSAVAREAIRTASPAEPPDAPTADPIARRMTTFIADLAVVNVATGAVDRIVERELVRTYAFSPDDRYVAYSVWTGYEPNAQQSLQELRVEELATGAETVLASELTLRYGIEWGWSPNGRRLAYMTSGQDSDGRFAVVSIDGARPHPLRESAPSFDPGDGEVPPIWSPDGSALYGVANGALWRVDSGSGEASQIARIDDWRIRSVVTASFLSPVAWSQDGGQTVWVTARRAEGGSAGIFAIDVATGKATPALQEDRSYGWVFSQAATGATGEIVFISRDQQTLDELWLLNTKTGHVRQASRINDALAQYQLGEARLIRWHSADGDSLAGALLLPPGYQRGTRLPLIVWVYGGNNGSAAVTRFGLWGSMATFNMHIPATRGYAVLYPDAPIGTGRTTEDLVATVLPGVDAAVAQGYADPERLAVMGQSYGAINTLALLTRTDRFDAAVITAAGTHPDLFAAYLTGTGYYEQGQGNMGGTIWEHPERYRENSPLFDFPAIETPLLIGQGDQDGDLVPSEAIFTALDRLGKHVEYRTYGGEGHVISGRGNVIDFWNRRLEFLAEHLKLRVDATGRVAAR
jgi:dipeptidyl aminopeptidase/acylaminoacyl peptidase